MAIKWKIFGITNYIMLLVYGFLLLGMFRFSTEEISVDEKTSPLLLLIFCFFIIILNSVFNLYIFHFHLPAKPIKRNKRLYRVSAIVYIFCLVTLLISIIRDTKYEIDEYGADDITYFVLGFTILLSAIGFFIAYNQFVIGKYLYNNYRYSIDKENKERNEVS